MCVGWPALGFDLVVLGAGDQRCYLLRHEAAHHPGTRQTFFTHSHHDSNIFFKEDVNTYGTQCGPVNAFQVVSQNSFKCDTEKEV